MNNNSNNSDNERLTQELKDLKKRYEAIEDELANSKKRLSKEMSDLTQYYEQRVLYELKTALSDPSCSVDERFVLLKERIQTLERKLDSKPGGVNSGLFNRPLTTHLSSSASSRLGAEGDDAMMPPPADYKRAQKLKKEHRKTRVIRIQPGEGSLLNITNNIETPSMVGGEGAQFLSPYSQTMRELELIATPDDNKQIDPDWANTPVGGGVGLNKRRSRGQISKKPTLRKIKSKSNFELPVIEANENENEDIVNN